MTLQSAARLESPRAYARIGLYVSAVIYRMVNMKEQRSRAEIMLCRRTKDVEHSISEAHAQALGTCLQCSVQDVWGEHPE